MFTLMTCTRQCVMQHNSDMGLRWDDEFEMEFSKDLQRDMNKFYSEHHRTPSSKEYKELTEIHLYAH